MGAGTVLTHSFSYIHICKRAKSNLLLVVELANNYNTTQDTAVTLVERLEILKWQSNVALKYNNIKPYLHMEYLTKSYIIVRFIELGVFRVLILYCMCTVSTKLMMKFEQ